MKTGEIIFNELNKWIYNDENQAGDKLQIIDASDIPVIIKNIVKNLTIHDVINTVCNHKNSQTVECEVFLCNDCGILWTD